MFTCYNILMNRYNTLNEYFKSIYGFKVYKISLDAGMSCPNRNKDNSGGCIFCSAGGSGDFAVKKKDTIKEQIDDAIKVIEKKGATKFIAYYQSYTNTYAPTSYLRKIFYETIEDDRIVGLSIATRPDSISDECIELLKELNSKKKVFIELGLQTSNDETGDLINRGYKTEVYETITKKLRDNGINVVTHVIIGLPNESEEDLINTIKYINDKTDGVKLHLLHVLNGTKLKEMYDNNEYTPLTKDEYYHLLSVAIEYLNRDIVIHRITGDGPKRILVEPKWSALKKQVLADINRYFNEHNIIQGNKYKE